MLLRHLNLLLCPFLVPQILAIAQFELGLECSLRRGAKRVMLKTILLWRPGHPLSTHSKLYMAGLRPNVVQLAFVGHTNFESAPLQWLYLVRCRFFLRL